MSHPKTSIFMVHWKTSSFGNLHIDQVKFLKMRKSRVSNQKETHETIWSLHSDNKRVWFCPKEMVNVLAKVRNLYNDQKKNLHLLNDLSSKLFNFQFNQAKSKKNKFCQPETSEFHVFHRFPAQQVRFSSKVRPRR